MGSRKMKMQMERLKIERERLATEIEALKNKLAGLDMAINVLKQDGDTPATSRKRPNVKSMTLAILNESGKEGVTAQQIVERAGLKGHILERASVSSLLSRLKREKTLFFDGSRYYPADQAPEDRTEQAEDADAPPDNPTKFTLKRKHLTPSGRVINIGGKSNH